MPRRTTRLSAPMLFEFDGAPEADHTRDMPVAEASGVYAMPVPELMREVLAFEAALLPRLPTAVCLVCTFAGTSDCVKLATAPEAVQRDEDAFVGPELLALLTAAESDRCGPADVARWWARKQKDPGYRLTSIEALGGVARDPAQHWTVQRWLRVMGLQLIEVRW